MKKFWKLLVTAVLSVTMLFSLTACGGGFKAKAVQIQGLEIESYGIAVSQDATTTFSGINKATLLAEINKVINDWTTGENGNKKIDKLVAHFQSIYEEEKSTAPFELYLEGDKNSNEKIIMATESGFAPFEFIDGNSVVGVDVALMGQVAKNLGKKLEILDINFESLTTAIFSKADVIAAGFTATEERKASMTFSNYYYTSTQYIVCAADADIKSFEELKGAQIGAQTGTTGAQLVTNEINNGVLKGSGAKLNEYKNAAVAFEDLKKGTLKAIILDSVPATCLVAKTA